MSINVTCLEFQSGHFVTANDLYDPQTNNCLNETYVGISTSDYELINTQGSIDHHCLTYTAPNYYLDTNANNGASCTSPYSMLQAPQFGTMQQAYIESLPPEEGALMPTPLEIAEAYGAGFFVTLPVLLTIFGGRMVLKSIFLSK